MEHADHLRIQISRYRRLLENVALDSVATSRVRAALTELEEQLRLEGKPATWPPATLRTA